MSENAINFDYSHKSDGNGDTKEHSTRLYSSGEKYLNYIEEYKIIINHFKSTENISENHS